jgi:hypothetical protein
MNEIKGPIWKVVVTLHDRFSGPEVLEVKYYNSESEAIKYAKSKDERGRHEKTPECYVSAIVEKA